MAWLSPQQTPEHSCQGELSPAWKGTPAADRWDTCPSGQQPPGDARVCLSLWLWSQEVAGREVTPPLASFHLGTEAEHREAERGRALCWHAGTCWGGEMQHLPRGWRLLGMAQQHSAPAAAAGNQAQRISCQKEATEATTILPIEIVQFVRDPWSSRVMVH